MTNPIGNYIRSAIRAHARRREVYRCLEQWSPPLGIDEAVYAASDGSVTITLSGQYHSTGLTITPVFELGDKLYLTLEALCGEILDADAIVREACPCPVCSRDDSPDAAYVRETMCPGNRYERGIANCVVRTRSPLYGED